MGIKNFVFRGHLHPGRTEGFPVSTGTYSTVCFGRLNSFRKGAKMVVKDGEQWEMVAESFERGCAEYPSEYSCTYQRVN